MSHTTIVDAYFDWMRKRVDVDRKYTKLLQRLHQIDFTYTISMDGNRYEDGIDLRYRFGRECGYDSLIIATHIDYKPCSVLEMMVALAQRCEETIMSDPEYGDRTGLWFWCMIESLGLDDIVNAEYNQTIVDQTIDILLRREYDRDGKGGLFTVKNPPRDMRSMEIWHQLNWFLDDFLDL